MDEHGDGGSVASVVEPSVMTVTVPSGDESVRENMDREVEDSFDGEDGEDLMIEVVGSDVFVDGVSGNDEGKEGLERGMESFGNVDTIEGDVGSKEVGDLEGQFWDGRANETVVEGNQDIPSEIDEMSGQGLQKEEVEAQGVEKSVGEQAEVGGLVKDQINEEQITGGVELADGEDKAQAKASQDTGVLDHEVWNPGIDGVNVSSLSTCEQEGSVDKQGLTQKDETPSTDVVQDSLIASGNDQSSDVDMVETVSEPSDKDNVHHANANSLDNPAETVPGSHVLSVTAEETIPLDTKNMEASVDDHCPQSSEKCEPMKDGQVVDNNVNHANSSVDTLSSSELTNCVEKPEIVVEHISTEKLEDSGVEPEVQLSDGKNEAIHSEDFPTIKQDGDFHDAPDSSFAQSSVDERVEWAAMDIDEVLDFKDDAIVLGPSDSVVSSTENVKDPAGTSAIVPDYGDAVNPSSSGTETGANDGGKTLDFVGAEGHVQSGLEFVEECEGLALENVEVAAEERSNNARVEVPEGDAAVGNVEHSDTVDITGVTEKEVVAEANLVSSGESSNAVFPVEHSTEPQAAVPVWNTTVEGPPILEINDNEVGSGILSQAEDVIDSNPTEVPVGIANRADSDVVHQIDCPEIKSKGDEKVVAVVEQDPEDSQVEIESDCLPSNVNDGSDVMQVDIPEIKSNGDERDVTVGEQYHDDSQIDEGKEDMSAGENIGEMDHSKQIEEKMIKTESSISIGQAGYLMGPTNEGEFSITDLVWGKVRSHPWWPGQIFDPADASDKAVKYYKKDSFLVAYFGDRTFAWNDASLLKPFRQYFSQIEKQSSSEAFQNAVSCALDEVSRRVMLGLSCSCISRDAHERIECQVVENTGIREESSRRHGVDMSTGAASFEPDKLLQYMRSLAESPLCLADRLELVLAQAQLSAFCCFKGYREPPRFDTRDAIFEKDMQTFKVNDALDQPVSNDDEQLSSPHKLLQNQKDGLHSRKERSLSELMGEVEYSPEDEDDEDGKALSKSVSVPSGKKRKAMDSLADGSDRRMNFYAAKVSTTSSSPKPSFKVGDCIRRVASQLTGSAPGLKGINEQTGMDNSRPMGEDSQQGMMVGPTEISLEEILSQLKLAARDPKKGYSFLRNIIVFFSGFRNSVVRKHAAAGKSGGGRKRKAENNASGATEEFEFDDVNDSYWTDRIVQNYSEEQLLQISENGNRDYQIVAPDANKVRKPGRGSYSRKRYSNGNYEASLDERVADVDRKKLELLPAELVLTFPEGCSMPSEIKLNKMFRRFGPLKESETEIALDSHRARVMFKRGADAEVAYSSVGRINIFGSVVVSYQLNYSNSTNFGSLPLLMLEGPEEAT